MRIASLSLTLLVLVVGCATLPENNQRSESWAYAATDDTLLGRYAQRLRVAHPNQSGFLLLPRGTDAFITRAILAEQAERSIDAQYYLLHDDLTGTLFIHELIKAADRGVRVRLLVDDMDLAKRDLSAVVLDAHPNLEVRIFNPFARNVDRRSQLVTGLGSVTRRMHNKSFTVDNQVTVLGGRNIGDEYFEASPALAFGDLDVLGIGPVAQAVTASFDQYWNDPLAYPITTLAHEVAQPEQVTAMYRALDTFAANHGQSTYMQALQSAPLAEKLRSGELALHWATAQVIADNPRKLASQRNQHHYQLSTELVPYLNRIEHDLIIFSPYFVPGRRGVDYLRGLTQRGVRVRILTNSLASTDVFVVHAGYARYRRELLRSGVKIYELNRTLTREQRKQMRGFTGSSKASLHTKSFVMDGRFVFIGSLNVDPRSFVENTEIGVVVDSTALAGEMTQWFEQNSSEIAFRVTLQTDQDGVERLHWEGREDGQPVSFEAEPYAGFWKRLGVGLLRLLPIESQL